ncbi:MAG: hypothetical protein MRJ65_01595 [Candidatus Brocadiaceae bacterium]|nr:hypothetical protein [Candidatus Brocadiaceae bacterium]
MKTQRKLNFQRCIRRQTVTVLFVLAIMTLAACSRSPFPGEQEEIPTEMKDVPAVVLAAAGGFCKRMGEAWWDEWFWDAEDQVWECSLVGLPRRAELDVNPDGSFSELELVYSFTEVEQDLPEVAGFIRTQCRTDTGVFVELSLRREEYLDTIPELKQAWSLSGIVLEFQCANGRDFEIDPRGIFIKKQLDDTTDISDDRTPPH